MGTAVQTLYKPAGVGICQFQIDSIGTTRVCSTQSIWPDYQEHDKSKELVKIMRISQRILGDSLATVMADVTWISNLFFAFRSGNFDHNSDPATFRWTKWLHKFVGFSYTGASTINRPFTNPLQAEWDFYDMDGLPVNPWMISCAVGWDSATMAASPFDSTSWLTTIEYKWVKATPADQNAYLSWESLG